MPNFSDYIIYADESGDHGLDRVDPQYPIFVLTFCIFKKVDYISNIVPMVQQFKFHWFGHDAVILHEREIRKQIPPFKFLQNQLKRGAFMDELSLIVERSPMVVITSIIDKIAHRRRYATPDNPYRISLLFCMERAAMFLDGVNQGHKVTHCVFEKRGAQEDRDLELEFRRIADGANYSGRRLSCLDIILVDKKANSSGLQIVDLIARPIGLHQLYPDQPNRAYEVIEPKIRTSPRGEIRGFGLKVFP